MKLPKVIKEKGVEIDNKVISPAATSSQDSVVKHESLDDPTNVIISGLEPQKYWDVVVEQCGVKTVLMTYQYLRRSPNVLARRLEKHPDTRVFIDSGAHTFIADIDKYKDKPLSFWEKHLEDYVAFIKKNKEYIFACADLDIDDIVGSEQVDIWRDTYFKDLESEGVQVCYIWHDTRGLDGWEEMCKRYNYIGMPNYDYPIQTLTRMFRVSKSYNTRVHGMALTVTDVLQKVPFYTADSSVDGKSSILVKNESKDFVERMTIEELYNRGLDREFRTTDFETRVPYSEYKVLTVDDNNNVIWGDLNGVVKHRVKKPTVKLKIEGGKELTCTTDHSLITMDKEGNLVETSADDLKAGDFVLAPLNYQNNNLDVPMVKTVIQKPGYSKHRGEVQMLELNSKFLQFLGLWLGDGHFSSGGIVGLACYQDKECREVIDYVANLVNAKVSVAKNGVDSRISSVRLYRIMQNLGFNGKSKTKRVPKFIYSLSPKQIGEFLKGYFSADGSGSCECSTVSKELKEDIVELLNIFGIFTSVSYRPSKPYKINGKVGQASEVWHISIRDIKSKKLFKEYVGFLQAYKNDKLSSMIEGKEIRGPKSDGIPKSLATGAVVKTDKAHSTRVETWKGSRISRKYTGVFKDKVLNSQLRFLKITSIEPVNDGSKEVEVYDLSVKDFERFFANGILVHNTTWLVGQQFGECCFFDNRGMKRLDKNQWQRNYKTKLMQEPLNADWERLMEGDMYELLRVNVLAFMQMQDFVRKRLGPKMYWMPNEATKRSLEKIKYPSYEWFQDESHPNLDNYLREFGMSSTEYTKEEALDVLYFFYLFLSNDVDHINELEEDFVMQYAQQIGGEPQNREEAISIIRQYFVANATGERQDFASESSILQPKERDNYLEDDPFEVVELNEKQVELNVGKSLPKPREGDMPEVEAYDEELNNAGISIVRDSKGRFIKGQKRVRKPKNVYSDKYPKLACDTCYKSGDCPQYKEGYVCAFDKMFKQFDTRNLTDIVDAMHGMVNMNMGRLQKAMLFETLDGGLPTGEVTGLIDQQMKYMEKLKDLVTHSPKTVVQQHRVIKEDGTESTVTTLNSDTSPGILSQIFGQGGDSEEEARNKKKEKDIIEAEVVEES